MSFSDYLVKIHANGNGLEDYVIPWKFIKFDSYKVFQSTTDLDSYRDQTGALQRTALQHKPVKVEFETPAMLTNDEFAAFMLQIQLRYVNTTEKRFMQVFISLKQILTKNSICIFRIYSLLFIVTIRRWESCNIIPSESH